MEPITDTDPEDLSKVTKIGKINKIAWTVENMQKAFDNLKNNNSLTSVKRYGQLKNARLASPVQTTHFYLRFLAKDTAEQIAIFEDSILAVSDVPFEAEIVTRGSYYHDPSLEGYPFTYLY
jgi:hypothetical protein